MSKIVINGRFLCRNPTGVDRFGTELLKVLDEWTLARLPQVSGLQFEVATPDRDLNWTPLNIPVRKLGGLDGHAWEQVTLPRHARGEVILSLCNTGPLLAGRQIVAIHDAAPVSVPASYSWQFRTFYRVAMPLLGKTARMILTVSDFSKREIVRHYGIDEGKIRVVPNSGEQVIRVSPDHSIVDKLGLAGRPYVLAVSTQAKHKNVELILRVAARMSGRDVKFVLVGGGNTRVFGNESTSFAENVVYTGFVSDSELRALYERAACFVFPSLYEGFGIPPLEAMELGCPVLSSDAACMPEVLGEAAAYFSPEDETSLQRVLENVLEDSQSADTLRARGLEHVKKYSWANSARLLVLACREVLSA
ncbi:glycosyltransferase family 4 protein [Pseudoxanthomonas suwonensis]|uniref:glycosyltransferase family 4 protein n=1 Tax=Pseudoxanthomonas suwonensis TaxID=314722 RepID=UPI0009E06DAE|nr:glycosyltransferase family 1 protein [Pseudoxanthomonas suwonensis]